MARIFLLLLTTFSLMSCQITYKTLSPEEKIKDITSKNVIKNAQHSALNRLKNFFEIQDNWLIAADDKIIQYDTKHQQIVSYLRYDLEDIQNLISGHDSLMELKYIDFYPNKAKDKVLVHSSNEIVFLLDLITHKAKWAMKFDGHIECLKFSNNDSLIYVGTIYHHPPECSYYNRIYYSTIFVIGAENGKYIKSYNDDTSVKDILLFTDDSRIYVVDNWNYTDACLWDANDTTKWIRQYNEGDYLKDGINIDDSSFVLQTHERLSLWKMNDSIPKKEIYHRGELLAVRNGDANEYLCQYKDSLYRFNKDLEIVKETKLDTLYFGVKGATRPNEIILDRFWKYDSEPSENIPKYCFYDIEKNKVVKYISVKSLNELFEKSK